MSAPPTAALPIAPCPVCKLKGLNSSCTASFGIVSCNWCAYQCGPASGDDAEAIELHNLLCAPAVQATADEAAREIVAGDLFDPEHTGWSLNKSVPIEVVTERISAIIRKAVSPKAAAETLAILQRLEDWGCNEDRYFATTRETRLAKIISDAQTVLHKYRKPASPAAVSGQQEKERG